MRLFFPHPPSILSPQQGTARAPGVPHMDEIRGDKAGEKDGAVQGRDQNKILALVVLDTPVGHRREERKGREEEERKKKRKKEKRDKSSEEKKKMEK